jgi:hypothetical protein
MNQTRTAGGVIISSGSVRQTLRHPAKCSSRRAPTVLADSSGKTPAIISGLSLLLDSCYNTWKPLRSYVHIPLAKVG